MPGRGVLPGGLRPQQGAMVQRRLYILIRVQLVGGGHAFARGTPEGSLCPRCWLDRVRLPDGFRRLEGRIHHSLVPGGEPSSHE